MPICSVGIFAQLKDNRLTMTVKLWNWRFLFAMIDINCMIFWARRQVLVIRTTEATVNDEKLLLVATITTHLNFLKITDEIAKIRMEHIETKNRTGSKVQFFLAYSNFCYFENGDRFLKTDFTIRLVVRQNLGKSVKISKKSRERLKT